MFKISSAFQYHMLTTNDLHAAIDGLVIKIFGDPTSKAAADALVPSNADDSIGSATLITTITAEGVTDAGLTFDPTPVEGALYKDALENWHGVNVASAFPSFYRIETAADTGAATTTLIRGQGTVAQHTADLIIAAAYMTAAEQQRIDSYLIAFPLE